MRPHLYVVHVGDHRRARRRRTAMVADLAAALRVAEDVYEFPAVGYCGGRRRRARRRSLLLAGEAWWLVAGRCEAEAIDQAGQLHAGRHPCQADLEWLHADIRNGLHPDLAPLRADDPCPYVGHHATRHA
jgi:hypothetical protein